MKKLAIALVLVLFPALAGCSLDREFAERQEGIRKFAQPKLEAYVAADPTVKDSDRQAWADFFKSWKDLNEEALK